MTEKLSAAIDVAVDTNPLVLRDALGAVLNLCRSLETDIVGNPSPVGHFIADQFRADIAKVLKVDHP